MRHTAAQEGAYWRHFSDAKKAVEAVSGRMDAAEAEAFRDQLTREALETPDGVATPGHKGFGNTELDLFFAACLRRSRPDDIHAQMRLLDGARRRLVEGIDRMADRLAAVGIARPDAYLATLAVPHAEKHGLPLQWRDWKPAALTRFHATVTAILRARLNASREA